RENFLSVMTLAKISSINDDSGFLGIPGLVNEGKMLFSNWDSKIPSLNMDQLNTYDTWIVESNNNRGFLRSIGADASLNSNVLKIYRNMNEPGSADQPQNANAQAKAAAQKRTLSGAKLWNDIQSLIKG